MANPGIEVCRRGEFMEEHLQDGVKDSSVQRVERRIWRRV
jgi:hypothetical protein